ncbi:ribonuclease T [Sphingomonas paeninsulae]|uniref:Ribonuclease T n=1 Tax=Sphingomonas paeninsulae TaxID=2319844 RepID=A0A494TIL4_SPHPE|nr:ribonuclease T [Sphingomonas paeninsulae]
MFRLDGSRKVHLRRISAWTSCWLSIALPAFAHAQAISCAVPANVPRPHADTPDIRNPRRVLPIASYTLALSWSPQFCKESGARDSSAMQCGGAGAGGNRFGFTLHGLWPDGSGKEWPQYCSAVPILSETTIRANLCATPSAQLLQHEYAKHGSCVTGSPDDYFRRSTRLYAAIRYPDMDRLSRQRKLTVASFTTAFARANRGLNVGAVRVTTTREGWLDEIWLCLDTGFRYERCTQGGGARPGTPLRIWRGSSAR